MKKEFKALDDPPAGPLPPVNVPHDDPLDPVDQTMDGCDGVEEEGDKANDNVGSGEEEEEEEEEAPIKLPPPYLAAYPGISPSHFRDGVVDSSSNATSQAPIRHIYRLSHQELFGLGKTISSVVNTNTGPNHCHPLRALTLAGRISSGRQKVYKEGRKIFLRFNNDRFPIELKHAIWYINAKHSHCSLLKYSSKGLLSKKRAGVDQKGCGWGLHVVNICRKRDCYNVAHLNVEANMGSGGSRKHCLVGTCTHSPKCINSTL